MTPERSPAAIVVITPHTECVCVCGSSNLGVFTWDFSVRYFKNTRLKTRVKMRFFSRCIDFLLHLPKIKSLPWNGVFTSWGSCFCPAKWDCVHIFTSPRCDKYNDTHRSAGVSNPGPAVLTAFLSLSTFFRLISAVDFFFFHFSLRTVPPLF